MALRDRIATHLKNNNPKSANAEIAKALGSIIYYHKPEFVKMLKDSYIAVPNNPNLLELVNLYIDNIDKNTKLALGSAKLLSKYHNLPTTHGFAGNDDNMTKGIYYVIVDHFSPESKSNAGGDALSDISTIGAQTSAGAASGGVVGAIAGAIGGIGNAVAETQKAKAQQTEADNKIFDLISKKQEAKNSLITGILGASTADKDAQAKAAESKSKNLKIALIIGGSVLGIAAIGLTIYLVRKKRKG